MNLNVCVMADGLANNALFTPPGVDEDRRMESREKLLVGWPKGKRIQFIGIKWRHLEKQMVGRKNRIF